jgi:predicted DNA binding CopG/RHH family protein
VPEARGRTLLNAVKASAAQSGMLYQRFIRQTLEKAIQVKPAN